MTAAPSFAARAAAWSVHLLTATGALWALLALGAIEDGRLQAAFGWMALAVVIDGVDGPLARRFRVAQVLPGIDGTLLDNLVDYLNYAVVPAWLVYRADLLPDGLGAAGAASVCVASAIQFTRSDAKTEDNLFRGFPSYWNIMAFYLIVLDAGPWASFVTVALLCALVFVPVYFVHPLRTVPLRPLTLTLTGGWIVAIGVMLWSFPSTPLVAWGSLLYAAYYGVLSMWLTARRSRTAA